MKRFISKFKKMITKKTLFEPFNSPNYDSTDLEPFEYLFDASDIEIFNDGKRFELKMTHRRTVHKDIAIKVLLETDPYYIKRLHVYRYLINYIANTKPKSYGSGKNRSIHRIEVMYHNTDIELLKYIYDILHILNHN